MESIADVKGELTALAQTKTLDELKSRGKKRVRVVRAQQIAEMISEAVQRTVRESGLVSHEEADLLVEKSRSEFRAVMKERETELSQANEAIEHLESVTAQREEARGALLDARKSQQAAQEDVEDLRLKNDTLNGQIEAIRQELETAQKQIEAHDATEGQPALGGMNADLMMKMMTEIAELKASNSQAPASAAPSAAAAPSGDLDGMIDKLAKGMNDRLDQFGRKMGISSAVDAEQVDFKAMFDKDDIVLESNMDEVEVKKKTGGGIAGNLARLKKLKGGD